MFDFIILQIKKEREETLYKVYVTDTLKMINDKLSSHFPGSSFDVRWFDLIEKKKVDTRTGEQIAEEVIRMSGLEFEEGGEDDGKSSI